MGHLGINAHKNASQGCIRTETGRLVERRVRTDRESFAKLLAKRDRAHILVESSTESERVVRCFEEFGHAAIVADPNFAPMYAKRSRKVKTDPRVMVNSKALPASRPTRHEDEYQAIRTPGGSNGLKERLCGLWAQSC